MADDEGRGYLAGACGRATTAHGVFGHASDHPKCLFGHASDHPKCLFGHASFSVARRASPWPLQRRSVPVLSVSLAVHLAKVALAWPKAPAEARLLRHLGQ